MTLIVSPKAAWLRQLGVVGDWSMAGLPKTLHLIGATEFKSKALRRGCGQYGVKCRSTNKVAVRTNEMAMVFKPIHVC